MLHIDRQIASDADHIPNQALLTTWISAALEQPATVMVRFVDEEEGASLNHQYRQKNTATNVLSFPFEVETVDEMPLLGDIIICAPVIAREAELQHKALEAHYAHMIIHGILHLLGYDHLQPQQANIMEQLEIKLLSQLGYSNPYTEILS